MNYIQLRTELEERIEKKLDDEVRNFNGREERPENIQKRFIEDHFDVIVCDSLEAIDSEDTDEGQKVYDEIVQADSFLDRIKEELTNYFSHFEI